MRSDSLDIKSGKVLCILGAQRRPFRAPPVPRSPRASGTLRSALHPFAHCTVGRQVLSCYAVPREVCGEMRQLLQNGTYSRLSDLYRDRFQTHGRSRPQSTAAYLRPHCLPPRPHRRAAQRRPNLLWRREWIYAIYDLRTNEKARQAETRRYTARSVPSVFPFHKSSSPSGEHCQPDKSKHQIVRLSDLYRDRFQNVVEVCVGQAYQEDFYYALDEMNSCQMTAGWFRRSLRSAAQ